MGGGRIAVGGGEAGAADRRCSLWRARGGGGQKGMNCRPVAKTFFFFFFPAAAAAAAFAAAFALNVGN